MNMGGAESFEHVQKPATAIQDHVSSPHVSSPNNIYTVLRGVYDQSQIFEIVKCIYKCIIVDWYQHSKKKQ